MSIQSEFGEISSLDSECNNFKNEYDVSIPLYFTFISNRLIEMLQQVV